MPGKVTAARRKTMLRLHRDGAADSEIMSRFEIWDRRTLKRQLRIAELEEREDHAGAKLIEDATAVHLEEIGGLIERWRESMGVPARSFEIESAMGRCREIEREPLFEGVRGHLPFRELWADYEAWKGRLAEYAAGATALAGEFLGDFDGGRLPFRVELKAGFEGPMVEDLKKMVLGEAPSRLEYEAEARVVWEGFGGDGDGDGDGGGDGDGDGDGGGDGDGAGADGGVDSFLEKFRGFLESYPRSERGAAWARLGAEIEELQGRVRRQLEEVLLRRDYILYRCRFCPGQRGLR